MGVSGVRPVSVPNLYSRSADWGLCIYLGCWHTDTDTDRYRYKIQIQIQIQIQGTDTTRYRYNKIQDKIGHYRPFILDFAVKKKRF